MWGVILKNTGLDKGGADKSPIMQICHWVRKICGLLVWIIRMKRADRKILKKRMKQADLRLEIIYLGRTGKPIDVLTLQIMELEMEIVSLTTKFSKLSLKR